MTWFWLVIYLLIIYVPFIVFFALIPYVTRRTESFGISIPEDVYQTPELKKLRQTYRNASLLINFSILAATLLVASLPQAPGWKLPVLITGSVLLLVVMLLAYLKGHFYMKKLKAGKNWQPGKPQVVIVDTNFSRKKITVSAWWFGLYILVIMATAAAGLYFYPGMPERVPVHFNLEGQADGWVRKSLPVIFFVPLTQTFLSGLMVFVYWVIRRAKQQVDAAQAEKSIEQNRIFRYRWSAFVVFMGLAILGMFGLVQLGITGVVNMLAFFPVFILIPAGIALAAIILSLTTGQGGSRVKAGQTKTGLAIDRNDDKYWKLGVFYYNQEDPALFVEKRFGIGWTNNLARPASWLMLAGLFVFIGVMCWLSFFLTT